MKTGSCVLLMPIRIPVLVLGGCDRWKEPGTWARYQVELMRNEACWHGAGIVSYRYVYSRSCFCPSEEDIVVTVVNGQVSRAFYTPSGTYLDEAALHLRR
jgi:hypothetical protein